MYECTYVRVRVQDYYNVTYLYIIYLWTCMCVYTCKYVCIYTCARVCLGACVCVSLCLSLVTCTYIYTVYNLPFGI